MYCQEFSDLSIGELTSRYLNNQKVPTRLHNAMQTILTKGKENHKSKLFRSEIIVEEEAFTRNVRHKVIVGREQAIHNILCLLVLYDTATIKKLLYEYYEHRNKAKIVDFENLLKLTEIQYLRFYCLGIESANIKQLIDYLTCANFSLFNDKLPHSILGTLNSDGLASLPLLFAEDQINWQTYVDEYKEAENKYLAKDFTAAKKLLTSLLNKPFKIPVAQSLSAIILGQEQENEEAWSYINKILN